MRSSWWLSVCVCVWLCLANALPDPRSWIKTITAVFEKAAAASAKLEEMRGANLAHWVHIIQLNPKSFKKMFDKVLHEPHINDVKFWWPQTSLAPVAGDPIRQFCHLCDYVSPTTHGMAWHMYNHHGHKHLIRRYIHDTHCIACMREFWTRNRVFTHLAASSARCRAYYFSYAFDIGGERYRELEERAEAQTVSLRKKGRRRTFSERPPEHIFGPTTPEATALGICPAYRLNVPPHVSRARAGKQGSSV